ncbi:MAG TPA: VCBS repeat-containing protein, partial [Urbifossiella sp.]
MTRDTMPTARRYWWAATAAILLIVGACSKAPEPPPISHVQTDPADIADQVHTFCGGSCHAYPPADAFPRKHWRSEVERGYRFFERSGLPLKAPPIESVIRYYEKQAPEELSPANCPAADRPLSLRFEKRSYPNPPGAGRPAISHVNLVHLPLAGKPAPNEPLSILACDMQSGRILLLRPSDPNPEWRILARVKNPSHAEVVDLDRDGVADLLVADLGSFPPTDRRCGSVVWLRGKADGTFEPITLLENVGRVADVRAAEFRGRGKLDLVVAAFGLHETGEILFLENRSTDPAKPHFEPKQIDA